MHPLSLELLNSPQLIDPARFDLMLQHLAGLEYDYGDGVAPAAPRVSMLEGPRIAVIPVHGPLTQRDSVLSLLFGGCSYGALRATIEAALASPDIGGILLDLDTPGGAAAGAFDFADWLSALETETRSTKPIWAIANECALSAGCLIASCAEKVFLPRTGKIGSVGVVRGHVDVSAAEEKAGIKFTHIHAGARKVDGSPHMPLSDEARALFQADADNLYEMFISTIARNRGMSPARVRATEAGTFQGQAAVDVGFATEVASFDQVVEMMAKRIGKGRPRMSGTQVQAQAHTVQFTASAPDGAEEPAMDATVLASLGLTDGASMEDVAGAIAGLTMKASNLEQGLSLAHAQIAGFQTEVSALNARVESATLEAAEARQALEVAQASLTALTEAKGATDAAVEALNADLTAARESLVAAQTAKANAEAELLSAHLSLAGFSGGSVEDAKVVIQSRYSEGKTVAEAVSAYRDANPVLFGGNQPAAVKTATPTVQTPATRTAPQLIGTARPTPTRTPGVEMAAGMGDAQPVTLFNDNAPKQLIVTDRPRA